MLDLLVLGVHGEFPEELSVVDVAVGLFHNGEEHVDVSADVAPLSHDLLELQVVDGAALVTVFLLELSE